MVGHLQDVGLEARSQGCEAILYRLLDVTGQQKRPSTETQSQNQGVVVEVSAGGSAARIEKFHSGTMKIELVPGLEGSESEAAILCLVEQFKQVRGYEAFFRTRIL